jgi:putative ABC transport system permease protein
MRMAEHWATLLQDLRYTARTLKGARGFAIATILITALGVGANTAAFSVADYVLVRPLPFERPEELVRLCEGPKTGGGWGCMNELSPANYRDVAAMNRSFAASGVFTWRAANLTGVGEPIRVAGIAVSPEVLPLLGVRPLLGRVFDSATIADDERSVILAYGLWQSQFGGEASVIGRSISLDGTPYTVIGVMPAHFRFPNDGTQLWTPLVFREADFANRQNSYLYGVARLKPGVTFEQARSDMAAVFDRLRRDHPENEETGFSFFKQRDEMSPRYRVMLLALCGASLCLLLLTCANLANLLLARAAGRERELAVRAALGAGRERLIRQLLTESVVLALIGGIAGALLAVAAVPLLAQLIPPSLPLAAQPTVDLRVFAIAATLSAVTGLGFGLIPALRVGGVTGFAALREGARGGGRRTRLRAMLVAFEVTLSVVLLISSGLLIRAIWRVQAVSPGFVAETVFTLRTALPSPLYDDRVRRNDFYQRVISEVRALPGVESAAYTSGLPMVLTGGITGVRIPGEEPRNDRRSRGVSYRIVTSQLFNTLRIPMQRGRDVNESDTRDAPLVAVVSESFAQRYWPDQDPIGKTFEVNNNLRSVVGVVADIKVRGLERTNEPQLYVPFGQVAPDSTGELYLPKDLLVRSARPAQSLSAAIRDIVRRVDSQQPISNVRMLADVVGDQTATRRAQLRILVALAVLALLLAAVGIHGLLAYTVAQRDREIGVRLALGADPAAVGRMIVAEGARMALIGVVPGIIIAYLAARGMSTLLFGVPAADPLTIAAVVAICVVAVVAACVRPALRAARIHPMSALRAD